MKKRVIMMWSSCVLCLAIFLAGLPVTDNRTAEAASETVSETEEHLLSAPRIEKDENMIAGQRVTWDCVYFGSYPQAEVISTAMSGSYQEVRKEYLADGDLILDDDIYGKLEAASDEEWDEQGDITLDNGKKYRRIRQSDAVYVRTGVYEHYNWSDASRYHYFMFQPVKWRVLSVNGTKAMLLSERVLDDPLDTIYDSGRNDSRVWLNEVFLNNAFSQNERDVIADTAVSHDGLLNGNKTEADEDTIDKLFFLSEKEAVAQNRKTKVYGFVTGWQIEDEGRRASGSTYAKAMGVRWSVNPIENGNAIWRLRASSSLSVDVTGALVDKRELDKKTGARVALNMDLEKASGKGVWKYAGTVNSREKGDDPVDAGVSMPEIEKQWGTLEPTGKWDAVYMGSYPQAEVVNMAMTDFASKNSYAAVRPEHLSPGDLLIDDEIYEALSQAPEEAWDRNGDTVLNGEKYRRIREEDATTARENDNEWRGENRQWWYCYHWKKYFTYRYFKYEPIKWRVVSVRGDQAELVSDLILDSQSYGGTSWSGSALRSWLNSYGGDKNDLKNDYRGRGFMDLAFTEKEKEYLIDTRLDGDHGGGCGIEDRVYPGNLEGDVNSSIYARAMGVVWGEDYFDRWSHAFHCTSYIVSNRLGLTDVTMTGVHLNNAWGDTVRPAVTIRLTSKTSDVSRPWSNAGILSECIIVNAWLKQNPQDAAPAPEGTTSPEGSMIPRETASPEGTAVPQETASPEKTLVPQEAISPANTQAPKHTASPSQMETVEGDKQKAVKKGQEYTVDGLCYLIRSTGGKRAACTGSRSNAVQMVSIPSAVEIQGKRYRVTEIADHAFAQKKKLSGVIIGDSVSFIGKKAFHGCQKLKNVSIRSAAVKQIRQKAFYGIHKKAVFKVPARKKGKYRKLLTAKAGFGKKMKVK